MIFHFVITELITTADRLIDLTWLGTQSMKADEWRAARDAQHRFHR